MNFQKICIIGLGYIGLPTAAMFASKKIKVIGVDINQSVVDTINLGQIHIVEPDLGDMVRSAVNDGFLRASTRVESADAFLIAVPTPFGQNFHPDLKYIEAASKAIAPVLKGGDIVILESTSPVGTTERMSAWISEIRPDLTFPQSHGESSDIRIAHCPERVLPGRVLHELIHNDRIIGGLTPKCSDLATELYKIFVKGRCIKTDGRTAEMCKLAENSFRDVNIAFANELSMISDNLGINVWELINLANRHPRVNILQPGPGVGGHCIAVDPWFIVSASPKQAHLIRAAREVNDSKPEWVINKVKVAVAECLQSQPDKTAKDVVIACFGLAFKQDIDDLRESPSLHIVQNISDSHPGNIYVVEPNISVLPDNLQSCNVRLMSAEQALTSADILVLLVDHSPFRNLPWKAMESKKIIDTRGLLAEIPID